MNWLLYSAGALGAVFILVKLLPYLSFFFSAATVVFKMARVKNPACQVPPDVIHVRDGHVSAWFVRGDEGWIAFDCGQHEGLVRDAFRKRGIDPGEVGSVFLTHTDADHVGGLGLFPQAVIFVSKEEEPLVDGTGKRTFSRHRVSFGGNRLSVPWNSLQDGQTLQVDGRKIECILTPGHTPGSMCYLVDDRYLFTGDSLGLENGRFTDFVPLFTMDLEEGRRSISLLVQRVGNRPVEFVFTGHSGCTDDFLQASGGW